jgi:F-box domain
MWCRNVLQLPLDVLVVILALLPADHLRTARTVCKAFRKASNLLVTRLSFCGSNISWKMINERLKVFKLVTCLDLAICKGPQASLLQRPAVLSRLRKVRLTCCHDAIIPLLAAAPRLTHLEVAVESAVWLHGSQFQRQLFQALRNCRRSVEVTLCMSSSHSAVYSYRKFEGIDGTPILRLIADPVWLPHRPAGQAPLAHFSRLECLDLVDVGTLDEVEAVATLTRLTRLALRPIFNREPRGMAQLLPLSQLTALQELKVVAFEGSDMRDFRQVVGPMVRMRELMLDVWDWDIGWSFDLGDVDFLLAALPAITCLKFKADSGMPLRPSSASLGNGFAGLRKLRKLALSLTGSPEHVAQLATQLVLPELEALSFTGDCQSFLSNLRPMPRLTELRGSLNCIDKGYDLLRTRSGGTGPMPYLSGTVLERFKSLQQLRLSYVLDMKQWDEDVKSLAMLTDLRVLRIGNFGPVTSEVLMPLTALKHLQKLELYPVSASKAGVTKFWEAMKAVRREMGFSCSVVPSINRSSRITFVF